MIADPLLFGGPFYLDKSLVALWLNAISGQLLKFVVHKATARWRMKLCLIDCQLMLAVIIYINGIETMSALAVICAESEQMVTI